MLGDGRRGNELTATFVGGLGEIVWREGLMVVCGMTEWMMTKVVVAVVASGGRGKRK